MGARPDTRKLPWPVTIFLILLVVPWVINIGDSRLSPSRIFLLFSVLPCLAMWASGKAGRIRIADIAVLGYCLWAVIAFTANYDFATAIRSGGLIFVETAGAYFLARCYIRSADDFKNVVALLFKIILVLLPFALFEVLTGQKPILAMARLVMPAIDVTMMDIRWGLYRAQGPFEHPLLFGTFCGSIFAMTHLVLGEGQPLLKRWLQTALVALVAFLSLSSGPLSGVAAQFVLLLWNWALGRFKARWKLLWGLLAGVWIGISLTSTQSVPAFYVTHAPVFDRFDAYYRLLEWDYGVATIMRHPIFGIGFEAYDRPDWMARSIDMFWLTHGVDFGLPGAFLMMLIFVGSVATVGFKSLKDDRAQLYRVAYLLSMTSFFLCGWTLHFWNATYCVFLFLLASGFWIADSGTKAATLPPRSPRPGKRPLEGKRAAKERPALLRRPSAQASVRTKSRHSISDA
ncbi:MAG TPA: O-antigen ligase family protein [Devosiaceae bacterium]|nr:O-antigen ligase family protein [Devosiaceae bacterium]